MRLFIKLASLSVALASMTLATASVAPAQDGKLRRRSPSRPTTQGPRGSISPLPSAKPSRISIAPDVRPPFCGISAG